MSGFRASGSGRVAMFGDPATGFGGVPIFPGLRTLMFIPPMDTSTWTATGITLWSAGVFSSPPSIGTNLFTPAGATIIAHRLLSIFPFFQTVFLSDPVTATTISAIIMVPPTVKADSTHQSLLVPTAGDTTPFTGISAGRTVMTGIGKSAPAELTKSDAATNPHVHPAASPSNKPGRRNATSPRQLRLSLPHRS